MPGWFFLCEIGLRVQWFTKRYVDLRRRHGSLSIVESLVCAGSVHGEVRSDGIFILEFPCGDRHANVACMMTSILLDTASWKLRYRYLSRRAEERT